MTVAQYSKDDLHTTIADWARRTQLPASRSEIGALADEVSGAIDHFLATHHGSPRDRLKVTLQAYHDAAKADRSIALVKAAWCALPNKDRISIKQKAKESKIALDPKSPQFVEHLSLVERYGIRRRQGSRAQPHVNKDGSPRRLSGLLDLVPAILPRRAQRGQPPHFDALVLLSCLAVICADFCASHGRTVDLDATMLADPVRRRSALKASGLTRRGLFGQFIESIFGVVFPKFSGTDELVRKYIGDMTRRSEPTPRRGLPQRNYPPRPRQRAP